MEEKQIRQRAQGCLPQQPETTAGQDQMLASIAEIAPPVRLCADKCQRERWPQVQQGSLPMEKAIRECAYEVNRMIGITVIQNLKLEEKPEEDLLKAWAALDYYCQMTLQPKYSEKIRQLMAHIAQVLPQEKPWQPGLFREVTTFTAEESGVSAPVQPAKPAPTPAVQKAPAVDWNGPTKLHTPAAEEAPILGGTEFMEIPEISPIPAINLVTPPEQFADDWGQREPREPAVQSSQVPDTVERTGILLFDEEEPQLPPFGHTEIQTPQPEPEAPKKGKTPKTKKSKAKPSAPKAPLGKKLPLVVGAALVAAAVLALVLLNKPARAKRAIDGIGQVTCSQDSARAIEKAESLCAQLEKEDLEKLENYEVLLEARAEYNRLETENAIFLIGTVTLESEEAIIHAEQLYAALTAQEKTRVENYDNLTSARQEYDRLTQVLQTAKAAVDGLGTITLESAEAVKAAREAYDAAVADGLLDYLTEQSGTLDRAETAITDLMSQKLFDEGTELYGKKKYQDALNKFQQILDDYPKAANISQVKESAADCRILLAKQSYQRGALYEAMTLLKAVPKDQQDQDYTAAMSELTQKLTKARPTNGKVFKNKTDWGWCQIDITASGSDVCVKIVSTDNAEKYQLIYVRQGETVKVKVKDGVYDLRVASGEYWYDAENLFGDDTAYCLRDDLPLLYSFTEGYTVYYKRVTVTLSKNDSAAKTLRADQF